MPAMRFLAMTCAALPLSLALLSRCLPAAAQEKEKIVEQPDANLSPKQHLDQLYRAVEARA
jgi:hypothetical protein